MIDGGRGAYPLFIDFDSDGDYDLLLTQLSEQLAVEDELSQADIKAGLDAVRQLLEHYFYLIF